MDGHHTELVVITKAMIGRRIAAAEWWGPGSVPICALIACTMVEAATD